MPLNTNPAAPDDTDPAGRRPPTRHGSGRPAAAAARPPDAHDEQKQADSLLAGHRLDDVPELIPRVTAFLGRPAPVSTRTHPALAAALHTAVTQGKIHRWWIDIQRMDVRKRTSQDLRRLRHCLEAAGLADAQTRAALATYETELPAEPAATSTAATAAPARPAPGPDVVHPRAVAEQQEADGLRAELLSGGGLAELPALIDRVLGFLGRPEPVSTDAHAGLAHAIRTAADRGKLAVWWTQVQPAVAAWNMALLLGRLRDHLQASGVADAQTIAILQTYQGALPGSGPAAARTEATAEAPPAAPDAERPLTPAQAQRLADALVADLSAAGGLEPLPALYRRAAAFLVRSGAATATGQVALATAMQQAAQRNMTSAGLAQQASPQLKNLAALLAEMRKPLETIEATVVRTPSWIQVQVLLQETLNSMLGFRQQIADDLSRRWDRDNPHRWPGSAAYAQIWHHGP